jgi:hypothetical protein
MRIVSLSSSIDVDGLGRFDDAFSTAIVVGFNIRFTTNKTECQSRMVTILLCSRKVPVSKKGPDTDICD